MRGADAAICPNGAFVNSQGRKPLGTRLQSQISPTGALVRQSVCECSHHHSVPDVALVPLQLVAPQKLEKLVLKRELPMMLLLVRQVRFDLVKL